MRGGTSKAVMFREADLPRDRSQRDELFLQVMGSPDPNGRQLDGMGGGLSSLSKVCVVGPSTRSDADVDYTFAQISVRDDSVDYSGNCGNMCSAVGPFAVEEGLVPPLPDGQRTVRIHNTNTSKVIVAHFPVVDGALAAAGDFRMEGVAGEAAPIRLEFLRPGGSKTGKLLPTGTACETIEVPVFGPLQITCVDAANPCVFVAAESLGKSGVELPDVLERDAGFLQTMEWIRCLAAVRMGLAPNPAAAAGVLSIPKVAMVSAPTAALTLSGRQLAATDYDCSVRMISVGQPHRAVPVTGCICLGVAMRIAGSVPQRVGRRTTGAIRVAHPSGITVVDAEVTGHTADQFHTPYAAIYRTARRLFEGRVFYRT